MRRRVRKCSKGFERPACAMFIFQSVRNLRVFVSKSCNFAGVLPFVKMEDLSDIL